MSETDLSQGTVSSQTSEFTKWVLEDRLERRSFRTAFTHVIYGVSAVMFIALLIFVGVASGRISPYSYVPTIVVLAGVPTALLVRAMEFAKEPPNPNTVTQADKTAIADGLLPQYELAKELLRQVGDFISILKGKP